MEDEDEHFDVDERFDVDEWDFANGAGAGRGAGWWGRQRRRVRLWWFRRGVGVGRDETAAGIELQQWRAGGAPGGPEAPGGELPEWRELTQGGKDWGRVAKRVAKRAAVVALVGAGATVLTVRAVSGRGPAVGPLGAPVGEPLEEPPGPPPGGAPGSGAPPLTVLVSLDGFHPAYVSAETTPWLCALYSGNGSAAEDGPGPGPGPGAALTAPYMLPQFPSQTFPNHWSLVTGLYPSEHGIVSNGFWDPELQRAFAHTDTPQDPAFWRGGTPLWQTVQQSLGGNAGGNATAATHMWPGSETVYPDEWNPDGTREPAYRARFWLQEPLEDKLDRVLAYLDMPAPPALLLAYVPAADTFAHAHGAQMSPQLVAELQRIDRFLEQLWRGVRARARGVRGNLVVVSDHGMSTVDVADAASGRYVVWEELLDETVRGGDLSYVVHGVNYAIRVSDPARVAAVHAALQAALRGSRGFRVYLRDEMPREWQFRGSEAHTYGYRIAPLWIVPEPGYYVVTRRELALLRAQGRSQFGMHGYNNTHPDMRAFFLGLGPYFEEAVARLPAHAVRGRTGYLAPFSNLEVYQLVCDTLQVATVAANNGSWQYPVGAGDDAWAQRALPRAWHESVPALRERYPDSAYNELWNWAEAGAEAGAQTTSTLSASARLSLQTDPSPPSMTSPPKPDWFHSILDGAHDIAHSILAEAEDLVDELRDDLGVGASEEGRVT
ncbi:LAMI_0H07074g1_1 [Lachancea mirantina]|uniref:LAMI_0H07074g1_1 n=1 Tax=Lachancea mirantina TaxID=1230905 RepID=A0A1G4KFP1_9SACH|nr:LAMI_0H07074g1_1 [Lachancea mirantina]